MRLYFCERSFALNCCSYGKCPYGIRNSQSIVIVLKTYAPLKADLVKFSVKRVWLDNDDESIFRKVVIHEMRMNL